MAGATSISGLVLVLEDVDLRTGGSTDNLGGDGQLVESVAVGDDAAIVVDDEERRERDFPIGLDALDVENVTLLDFRLLAAGANDGVHDPSILVVDEPTLSARSYASRAKRPVMIAERGPMARAA